MKRIVYKNDDGGVSIIIPAIDIESAIKDVPAGKQYSIIDVSELPTDRLFRNALETDGKSITHNIEKCKGIAHGIRRDNRAKEFAPLDIEVTIPSKAQQAEAERQVIRDKYAGMQTAIDAANNPEEIKLALSL